MVVEVVEQVFEFAAGHAREVGEGLTAEEGEPDVAVVESVAQQGGVVENAGVEGLAHHVGEACAADVQVVAMVQVLGVEGGTLGGVHGWQLRIVSDEEHPIVRGAVHVLDEVVQQTAHPWQFAHRRLGRDHRGLVHDEERVAVLVLLAEELADAVARAQPVDPLMDGVGLATCVLGDDLGGTPGGSQDHRLHLQLLQGTNQRAYQAGLARACVALQDEEELLAALENETRQGLHRHALAVGGLEPELGLQSF